jgi:hypothetical protein
MTNIKEVSTHSKALKDRDIQVERLVSMVRSPKTTNNAINEDINNRNRLLRRMFTAIAYGDFKINGQAPDSDYQLAENLIHGGRILFDLSALSPLQQQGFRQWLKYKAPIKSRAAATHAIGEDKHGKPMDIKTGAVAAMSKNMVAKTKGQSTHYGMDVHAGGYGKTIQNYKGKATTVKADGRFGHLYINDDSNHPNALQMGFEEAGALLTNQYTGDFHSPTGGGGKFSAFGAFRLGKVVAGDDRAPMIIPESRIKNAKYNWNRVKITPENYMNIMRQEDTMSNHQIRKMLRSPHPQAIKVTNIEDRMNAMADYRIEHGFGIKQIMSKQTSQIINDAKVDIISGKLQFNDKKPGIKQVLLAGGKEKPAQLYYCKTDEDKASFKKLLENHGVEIKAEGAINVDITGKVNVFSGILHDKPNLFNVLNLATFFEANDIDLTNTKIKTLFSPCEQLDVAVESHLVKTHDDEPDYYLTDANTVITGVVEKVKLDLKHHVKQTCDALNKNSLKKIHYWLTAKAKKLLFRKTSGYEQTLLFSKELKITTNEIDKIKDFNHLNEIIHGINNRLKYLKPDKHKWLGDAKKQIGAFQEFKSKYKKFYGKIEKSDSDTIGIHI